MNKVSGTRESFAYCDTAGGTTRIGYGLQQVSGNLYEWNEVYLYAKQHPIIGLKDVKDAIIGDINAETDEKILSGFQWTPEGGSTINVWLSEENQRNFSEAQRMAEANSNVLPITFKLGEEEDETPVYHTFETAAELNAFYLQAFAYINQCLQEGWAKKDGIDWAPYEELFPNDTPQEG